MPASTGTFKLEVSEGSLPDPAHVRHRVAALIPGGEQEPSSRRMGTCSYSQRVQSTMGFGSQKPRILTFVPCGLLSCTSLTLPFMSAGFPVSSARHGGHDDSVSTSILNDLPGTSQEVQDGPQRCPLPHARETERLRSQPLYGAPRPSPRLPAKSTDQGHGPASRYLVESRPAIHACSKAVSSMSPDDLLPWIPSPAVGRGWPTPTAGPVPGPSI